MSDIPIYAKIIAIIVFSSWVIVGYYRFRYSTRSYRELSHPVLERQLITYGLFCAFVGIYSITKEGESWNYLFTFIYALGGFALSYSLTQLNYIVCPHCLKNIKTDRNWKCPYCSEDNKDSNFFYKCKHCKDLLTHYQCPDCKNEIDFNIPYNQNELRAKRND